MEATPPVPGSSRVAGPDDRALPLRWWIAFGEEVLHHGGPGRDQAEATLDRRLSSPNSGILLWEDGGEAVSLAGWGGPTPNGICVGRVYTPPELRGHGYATALTSELSHTHLANPTSNAIYERIGYRRVPESAEIAFS